MIRKITFSAAFFSCATAYAQPVYGPLQAQNSLSELATNGTQATARANISAAQSGGNADITSLTGLTTPLAATEGGTGVNNGSYLLTLFGNLTTAGGSPITFTTTGSTSLTLPTTGTLLASTSTVPYSQFPALSANQLLGSLTATYPTGQSVPACTGANAALQWTSGVGFGCVTISAGTNAPGGANTDVQYNNSTSFAGNSSFTYNGSGGISLGTPGSTNGSIALGNTTSGTITLSTPTGALGSVTDTLPLGGTLMTLGQANSSFAVLGANNNITSLSGLTTPLSPFQGGDGVQNSNSAPETRSAPVTFSGGFSTQFATTAATNVTLPTSGTLLNNISTANNTVVGSTSSTALTDLAVPGCTGSGSALQWVTGSGFNCGSITGTAAVPAGSSGQVQYNSSGVFGAAPGFTFNGGAMINLGVSGTSVGQIAFNNATSGSITLQAPTGALGSVTDTLPLGGTVISSIGGVFTGGLVADGGLRFSRRTITGSTTTDTASSTDIVIDWNATATSNKTETIPACAPAIDGQVYIVKDEASTSGTYPISITPTSGTIEKAATFSANFNSGSWTITCDGSTTNWTVN